MSHRYKIRTFQSSNQSVDAGTVVTPVEKGFSIFSRSVDEAERQIQNDLLADKLPKGLVYQVCPPFGNPESMRAFAASQAGEFNRVYLDPASGVYSESRRIRMKDLRVNVQRELATELQKA